MARICSLHRCQSIPATTNNVNIRKEKTDVRIADRNRDGMFGGDGSFMWFLAILILLGGGNGFFGNNGYRGDYVTQAQFADGLNSQSMQAQLQQIA